MMLASFQRVSLGFLWAHALCQGFFHDHVQFWRLLRDAPLEGSC